MQLAFGMGGKVALIDTENGSASLYSHLGEFDVCEIAPPFTVQKYIEAIKGAEQAGYDVLVVDSLTHAWAGQGGLLEEVDKRAASSSSKNSYAAWRDVTPMHNRLVDTILQSNLHMIVTMRSKTAYEMEKGANGKVAPVKKGMAPIQRDGLEYEFTVVLDLDNQKHVAEAGKDRTGLFDGKVCIPTQETGKELIEWLDSGSEPSNNQNQKDQIVFLAKKLGMVETMPAVIKEASGTDKKMAELTESEANKVILYLMESDKGATA